MWIFGYRNFYAYFMFHKKSFLTNLSKLAQSKEISNWNFPASIRNLCMQSSDSTLKETITLAFH